MEQAEQDRKALEALEEDIPDLKQLEALSNQFNIFEAFCFTDQELRHSDFLAFLLNPRANHGLGDLFAKRLLKQVLKDPDAPAYPGPQEIDGWDLGEMSVFREWNQIDILLLDRHNRMAVIIENKIWSNEHSDQLARYYDTVKKSYPGYGLIAVYLSPLGEEPSHPAYVSVSYVTICEILEEPIESQVSISNAESNVLMKHYTRMLRKHILGNSEIESLARQMYLKHQKALDLLHEYRPDPQKETRRLLISLMNDNPKLSHRKTIYSDLSLFFRPQEWKSSNLESSNDPHGFMRFRFRNNQNELTLTLDALDEDEEKRRKLYDMARKYKSLFGELGDPEAKGRMTFYARTFLTPQFCDDATVDERLRHVREQWTDFLENDLPRIDDALKQEAWIWEPEESENSSN